VRFACALLVAAAAASAARAVPGVDLAVVSVRAPARVTLTDAHPKARTTAALRVANRGTTPITVADAAALARLVRLSAAPVDGPVACAPLAIAPPALRFPLTLRPGRARTLRWRLDFTCGPNPGATADWKFAATAGTPDADPADDTCPRAGTTTDPGCGVAGPGGARLPPTTDVRDARAASRFEVPGPYRVGQTSLTLVDGSRPTMPNGTFAGAPDRTLPTTVWYPASPDAGGPDAPLASNGRPFPLIVFAHALGSYANQSTFLTTHLASHGYVVAAPAFPLMSLGAPGGSTIADVPAQVGDVSFVIDAFLGFARDPANRFAGGIDAARIGLSGHSGGALTTLVATYDARVREPRIKAALPFAPPACFLRAGYFDAASVPLLVVQGDQDLLVDPVADAAAVYERARPPKALLVVHGGTHLGFADVGAGLGDGVVCATFPDPTDLNAGIAAMIAALGGVADHLDVDGCRLAPCVGDGTHVGGPRQLQIGKEAALAFFEQVLRGDRAARRYLATLGARNPDVTLTATR